MNFTFTEYLKTLTNETTMKLSDNIIDTIIDPSIKYSKRLKNRDLFFVDYSMDNIAGPGMIFKNTNENVQVNRDTGMIFIPINMFKMYQIKDGETIRSLKTFNESEIFFETPSYIILNPSRIISYANMSRFNKVKDIKDLNTYGDLIQLLETYKKYFVYKN
jgi:hypothetical protein